MSEPDHHGICIPCGIVCFWQDAPTGGWWIHDWPSEDVERAFKQPQMDHKADPGWQPQEEQDDEGNLITVATRPGCDDDTNHILVPHDFWSGQ